MQKLEIKSILFDYRFEVLAFLLSFIIFGGGFPPSPVFDNFVMPITVLFLAILAIVIAKNQRKPIRMIFSGFALIVLLAILSNIILGQPIELQIVALLIFILFLATLSFEVFRQMIQEKDITLSIIFAAFDCYLLLGVLGAMLFTLILYLNPDAFTNVSTDMYVFHKMNYFSFITLTSIGYGDITPNSVVAEKFTAFFGLIGHFYSVVVVGIIVGKYVAERQSP